MTTTGRFAPRKVHLLALGAGVVVGMLQPFGFPKQADASWWTRKTAKAPVECVPTGDVGGSWYWMRSPDQEQRIISAHYNRYCLRCHGADGRGVWDIPDVPDLTSAKWHAHRTDEQLTRGIVEGRGACMPAFRGTLTLEESWAMARYLRTFVPGSEASKPDTKEPKDAKSDKESKDPKKDKDADAK